MAAVIKELLQLLMSGQLRTIIGQTFPLAQAAEAHRVMAERKTLGKSIVIV